MTRRFDRRQFVATAAAAGLAHPVMGAPSRQGSLRTHIRKPMAITMWDFSWLERRWPGAGYEDWDTVLDGLKQRGYDAVRIDAYPHLIAAAPDRQWTLLPEWSVQDWGAPAKTRVQVQPALNQFIRKCGDRGLAVGLSTWFREDVDKLRLRLTAPAELGRVWKAAIDSIAADGLLKHILYVDLCNEFPLNVWAPFTPKGLSRATPEGVRWMREPIADLRKAYPQLDYTFSFTSEYENPERQDVSMLDFLELHLWFTHFSDFNKQVGYNYERFDSKGYENMAERAEKLYRSAPEHWKSRLSYGIEVLTKWSDAARKPLITTECWGPVDYKDWPLLDWGWVKELCEHGVKTAAATGRWAAMATSNFCGPQFEGMWRDVAWHRRLTSLIHDSRLPATISG